MEQSLFGPKGKYGNQEDFQQSSPLEREFFIVDQLIISGCVMSVTVSKLLVWCTKA